MRNHALPGVERVGDDGRSLERLLTVAGALHPVALAITETGVRFEAETVVIEPAAAIVRAWFDLDSDVVAIGRQLSRDPLLARSVAERPGLRATQYPEAFEAAVMAVLGQQVSVAAARTFGARTVAAFGTRGARGLLAFPTPAALLAPELEELRSAIGVTSARARTVRALARAVADGLVLDGAGDLREQRRLLLALPGIGPWTADYLALRLLGDPDAFPAGDLVLRRALGRVSTAEAEAASQAWRPHRAHAAFHLWASTGAV
ncbi:DNA-3-methyladenine glycosylase II [Rathayibacter tanaceti]|uniref:DNA-3-methyladenine glycosylase II n=2 Tax=Rathayibacter tanaceti TaxID=1671680 RepID=A0A166H1R9_9MICO|nr:DNA-3-methyladenine glycosylase [Rathayibacter tanaceti]QHC54646.1 3-methyladenine DNA glycosylase 2 [Rathayibacter tanaceti]TCO37549.1 DNA-3-methyladenine glycosylase II [Rathayibacter tanaceti]